MTGEENAGQSAKNERGGAKGEGEIRGGASRNQSIQSKVYGRHDASVWEVPGNGGAATTVLQRRSLRYSQMSEYFAGSSVSSFSLLLHDPSYMIIVNLKIIPMYFVLSIIYSNILYHNYIYYRNYCKYDTRLRLS